MSVRILTLKTRHTGVVTEYVLRALYAAVLLLRAQHNKWSLYYTTQLLQQIHRRLFDYQRITL